MNKNKLFLTAIFFAGISMSFAGYGEDGQEYFTLEGEDDVDYVDDLIPDSSFNLDDHELEVILKILYEIELNAHLKNDYETKEIGRGKVWFPKGTMPSPEGVSDVSCPSSTDSFDFKSWDAFVPVDGKKNYEMYAPKSPCTFVVRIMTNDEDCGYAYGSGVYKFGDKVFAAAEPKEGCVFDRWSDGEESVDRLIKVHGDTFITAFFKNANAIDEAIPSKESDVDGEKKAGLLRQANKPQPVYAASVAGAERQGGVQTMSTNGFAVPQFRVSTIARNIRVSGARVGASYEVMDVQGRMMLRGRVDNSDFNLNMPDAGSYMLRVGSETQRVTIR